MKAYIINTRTLLCLLLLAFSFSACYRDLGNYNYTELNDFSIADFRTQNVSQGDTIRLTPVIQQNQNDEQRFGYRWTLELDFYTRISMGLDSNSYYISAARNLAYIIPAQLIPSPVPYGLKLEITDLATGVKTSKTALFVLGGLYANGWVILDETAQGGDIAFYRDGTTYRNLFEQANNRKIPGPVDGLWGSPVLASNGTVLLVSGRAYGKLLNPINFMESFDLQDFFPPALFPQRLTPAFMGRIGGNELPNVRGDFKGALILSTGQIVAMGSDVGDLPNFNLPLRGSYALEPFISASSSSLYVYDRLNKRFGGIFSGWGRYFNQINNLQHSTAVFDLNNIGDKTMVYGGDVLRRFFTCIFKDAQNNYSVYQLDINNTANLPFATYTIDENQAPGIKNASAFACSDFLPLLYYGSGNALYRFDVNGTRTAQAIYSFAPNEQITKMQWNRQNQMAVATWDGTQGRFYLFSMTPAGTFTTTVQEVDGFGVIKSLYYKIS